MMHRIFRDYPQFVRFILYADTVLVTFFLARVVMHEFGKEFILPLVATAGVLLILLDNRRFARGIARMATRTNPGITQHRMYAFLLRMYGEGIHRVTGATLVGTTIYSFLF